MKCAEFINKLYRDDSFDECASHYRVCQACRIMYKDEYELEKALRDLGNDSREFDISGAVKREIRTRRIKNRELSLAKISIWALIGLATVYCIWLMAPIAVNWIGLLFNGLQSVGISFGTILTGCAAISEKTGKSLAMGINKEFVYLMAAICGLSMIILFKESKEFLVKLRFMLNR
jgi:predicted anti-sigma-YlaC factor YlaD